jgi:hypothetical protein
MKRSEKKLAALEKEERQLNTNKIRVPVNTRE